MEKLKMKSLDAVDGNVAKIAALFPHCVTERKGKDGTPELAIDFDKLRAELSKDVLDEGEERYQFTWPDKRAASRLANTAIDKTLRPDLEASKDFWNTENLYIEGDNLDVLKVLRENYLGKIKMIYIDPPYNTGNDFVYNDDFAQGKEDFEATNGLYDEDGNQILDPMQRNTESNGRFHTDWLNMIYPRLKVARDLLSDDGVVFISIDDNEVENLRKVCDEIFGERNFIANIIWQSTPGSNTGVDIITITENILVYGKHKNLSHINMIEVNDDSKYILSDSHESRRGKYILNKLDRRMTGPHYSEALNYPIIAPDGTSVYPGSTETKGNENWNYRWSSSKVKWGIENDFIVFKKVENKWNIYFKQYFKVDNNDKPITRSVPYQNLILSSQFNTTQGSTAVFNLFGNKFFDYAKPVGLVKHFLGIACEQEDIILDFFSGSGTTAHAVMKLNAEDGGKRKFIMVQLPEVTDEKSEARKAGYENICQIGEERIRRAGEKVKEEAGDKAKDLDVGFRVLKLDSSNMEDVFYTPEEFNEQHLFNYVDNVKSDRTPLDLLFQVLPELGIELSAKIEERDVNGKKVFFVDGTYLIATFDTEVNESTVTEIAKMKPDYFVMRDASAANDNVLDNFEQIFKHYSPETIKRVL
ncbi:MAG: site-specific DNA-methyltransferase [Bacteroidales bacterium]|nr:site-specific DNA-methyltransferase [Bacteroidales bacterium]